MVLHGRELTRKMRKRRRALNSSQVYNFQGKVVSSRNMFKIFNCRHIFSSSLSSTRMKNRMKADILKTSGLNLFYSILFTFTISNFCRTITRILCFHLHFILPFCLTHYMQIIREIERREKEELKSSGNIFAVSYSHSRK